MKKRITAVVLCVALFLMSMPMALVSAATTYDFATLKGYYKTQGRVNLNGTALEMDTTSSGFEFYFNGSGSVTLSATVRCTYSKDLYLTVIVDGVRSRLPVEVASKGVFTNKTLTLVSGLAQGLHHIEVYKQSEAVVSLMQANSITINGTPISTPPSDKLTMEVVGDSISGGASMWNTSSDQSIPADYPYFLDGTKTYAYLAGEAIGANVRVTQTSGYGLVNGVNTDGITLPMMYPYTSYWRSTTALYSFDPPADIVVINLGTNDAFSGLVSDAQFKQGVMSMMTMAREKNPGSKVVWCTGMMGTFFPSAIKAAVSELGGAQSGYYYCELPYGADGGYAHPNVEQHAAAGEVLKNFLLANCLPADHKADFASADALQTELTKAQGVSSPSTALTQAIKWANAELSWGTTDAYRLGVRLAALRDAMAGTTAVSLMPRQYIATCPRESNGSYVWPYYGASDGMVTLYKGGEGYYWPHIETIKEPMTVDLDATPYLRIEADGTAYFNLWLVYLDKNGAERTVSVSAIAGNGDVDYSPGKVDLTVNVQEYFAANVLTDSNGDVPLVACKIYTSGDMDVYTHLKTCAFISNEKPAVTLGDVNDDGDISTADARFTILYALEAIELDAKACVAADYNGDGEITTQDARLIMLYALLH